MSTEIQYLQFMSFRKLPRTNIRIHEGRVSPMWSTCDLSLSPTCRLDNRRDLPDFRGEHKIMKMNCKITVAY